MFDRKTIDPKNKKNKVYSEDAWTPMFPNIGYKLNDKKALDIYGRAAKVGPLPMFEPTNFHRVNYEDSINGLGSESLIKQFRNDYSAKQFFLAEQGNPVTEFKTATVEKYDDREITRFKELLDKIGIEKLKEDRFDASEETRNVVRSFTKFGKNEESLKRITELYAMRAIDYVENGNTKKENSFAATEKEINSRIDQAAYEKWLEELFSGIIEKRGIRNEKDAYTPAGNRRAWESLYDEITLDNVVKVMSKAPAKGGTGLFGGNIFGSASEEFGSIDEIRQAAQERIKSVDPEEMAIEKQAILDRLSQVKVTEKVEGIGAMIDLTNNIKDAVAQSHTPEGIYKYLKELYPDTIMEAAQEISDIVKDIQQLSTRYFEAKPYRAVKFDEVKLAVVPEGTSLDVVTGLEERGVPVRTYEAGNQEQRKEIVNSATKEMGLRFSVRENNGYTNVDGVNMSKNAKKAIEEGMIDIGVDPMLGKFIEQNGYGEYDGEYHHVGQKYNTHYFARLNDGVTLAAVRKAYKQYKQEAVDKQVSDLLEQYPDAFSIDNHPQNEDFYNNNKNVAYIGGKYWYVPRTSFNDNVNVNPLSEGDNDTRFRVEGSKAANERRNANENIDKAIAFVRGISVKEASDIRKDDERKIKEKTTELYNRVLNNQFDDVTLRLIDEFIANVTPENPYRQPLSKRLPPRVGQALRRIERNNAVDGLFTRIAESTVREIGSSVERARARREVEEKKKELLKGWAIATGNWRTSVSDFTDNIEPIGKGKDSIVYNSNDGNNVIKVSFGKNKEKKFSPDIDAVNLFNAVFPNTRYEILGYGEIDGKFVKFLKQPSVRFSENPTVSVEDRIDYMRNLGFEPINKEKSAFSNGELVVADVQKGNIVRDVNGEIRVIDADVKLHTKDIGGDYTYPPASDDILPQDSGIAFRIVNDNQQVFVSNALASLDKIQMKSGNAQAWINKIQQAGGLKKEEDKWIGLTDWLKEQKGNITKEDVAEFIRENQIKIEEVNYQDGTEIDDFEGLDFLTDEYNELLDMYADEEDPQEYADAEMEARYGRNFWFHFFVNGEGQIDVQQDSFDTLDEMLSKLRQYDVYPSNEINSIDSIRLDYTTGGLRNNREIALTVPNIQPYNEYDKIHFGDAGEGRAVAWIRFGDARGKRDLNDEERSAIKEKIGTIESWTKFDGKQFVAKRDIFVPSTL
ncbi:MAG: hypothetical protein ACI4TK_01300 [Agathobacter sp.]